MYITVFESEEWEAAACRKLLAGHHLDCTREALTPGDVSFTDSEIISTFVNSRLSSDVLKQFPKLRFIATRSTGTDHIDLEYCSSVDIKVANVPSYGDATVAEHAFALLLALTRNLLHVAQPAGVPEFEPAAFRGSDLQGKTMGVIGTGRIGQCVIRIARGFDMQVIAYDRVPRPEIAQQQGISYVDLDHLLRHADVVTLHVPADSSTTDMIGDAQFNLMKTSAILINTARGSVVNVAALVNALTSRRIRAAGLDVLPQEPLMREEAEIFRSDHYSNSELRKILANHVLMTLPNVIVTPHVAYNTEEAVGRIIDTTISNIEAFVAGRPINTVN